MLKPIDKTKYSLDAQFIPSTTLEYRCFSEIEMKPFSWLWKGRIAKGKLTIIAGNPGLGKSQLSANISAIVTTGGIWPLEQSNIEPGGVIILSAEDDPEDTIGPRLKAAGADLNKIYYVDAVRESIKQQSRTFNLKIDILKLSEMLKDLELQNKPVSLVIIDPITAYLGDTDAHNNAEVRGLLVQLSDMASEHCVSIIGISHLNKNGNADALMRVSGSLAFVAAARAAFLVAQDDEDESKRLFLPLKNNIGNDKTGLAFGIETYQLSNGIETSRIVWADETILKTARDIMSPHDNNDKSAKLEAEDFLIDVLFNGAKSVSEIKKESEIAGHTWATIRRAKESLKIEAIKDGMKGGWVWQMPPKALKNNEDAHSKHVSTFDNNEHLQQNLNNSSAKKYTTLQCQTCGYRPPFCKCEV